MPEKKTMRRARKAKRQGKSPSTQAGEYVHEEIEHVREGKHRAQSPEQVIAIGLSKARKAGVKVPKKGSQRRVSMTKSKSPAGHKALSKHAKKSARAARKAAHTREMRTH